MRGTWLGAIAACGLLLGAGEAAAQASFAKKTITIYIGFTAGMTSGRGFIALGAVLLGARHPVGVLFAAVLFGAFDALTTVLPGLYSWIPPELIRMIPFAVTIVALLLFSYRAQRALAMRGAR